MIDPSQGAVIPGTGGLRKTRFARRGWNKGKSGAMRIGYFYSADQSKIALIAAYAKSDKENLTREERQTIKKLLDIVWKRI